MVEIMGMVNISVYAFDPLFQGHFHFLTEHLPTPRHGH
tara:strand:- start:318 stop:431 length:114 start_codon:yes stop_codon:yes gene_type:complete